MRPATATATATCGETDLHRLQHKSRSRRHTGRDGSQINTPSTSTERRQWLRVLRSEGRQQYTPLPTADSDSSGTDSSGNDEINNTREKRDVQLESTEEYIIMFNEGSLERRITKV